MGADCTVKLPPKVNKKRLEAACHDVPIDVNFHGQEAHFHYAYWGRDHAEACEKFVADFCSKYDIEQPKWGY